MGEQARRCCNVEGGDDVLQANVWIVDVKGIVDKGFAKGELAAITRVPQALVKVKPEAYIPQVVSLGPFYHRRYDLSRMEKYKPIIASGFQNFKGVVECIKDYQVEMAKFYDYTMEEDELESFAWMMALDALFFLNFLFKDWHPNSLQLSIKFDDFLDISSLEGCIRCDLLKLENQIPLFVLNEVFLQIFKPSADMGILKSEFNKICRELSSFDKYDSNVNSEGDQMHFLGCIHTHVSNLVNIEKSGDASNLCVSRRIWNNAEKKISNWLLSGVDDFPPAYNAKELSKAGIKFKPSSSYSENIRFDGDTDTFYLPTITLSDTTEVVFRNLLALEFNDPNRGKHVTRYVELMDSLIDTAEDVSLLRKFRVIHRGSRSDGDIASMWNGMCSPFYAGFIEPPEDLKTGIKETLRRKYCITKIKTLWSEFHQTYLSRPWHILGLLCGIFILLMDTTQTYCSFRECNSFKPEASSGSPSTGNKHF